MDLATLDDAALLAIHESLHADPAAADPDEHVRVVEALEARGFGHGGRGDALDRSLETFRRDAAREALTEADESWTSEAVDRMRLTTTKAIARRIGKRTLTRLGEARVGGAEGGIPRAAAFLGAIEDVEAGLVPAGVSVLMTEAADLTEAERATVDGRVAKLVALGGDPDQAFVDAVQPDSAPPVEARVTEAADAIWVGLVLPDDLGSQFPDVPEDDSPPHVTLAYAAHTSPDQVDLAERVIRDALRWQLPMTVDLIGYGEFESHEGKTIAHMVPRAESLAGLRDSIAGALERAGIMRTDHPGPWVPHVTLAYLAPGDHYEGPRPTGNFVASEIRITRGDDVRTVPIEGDLREAKSQEVRDSVLAYLDAALRPDEEWSFERFVTGPDGLTIHLRRGPAPDPDPEANP